MLKTFALVLLVSNVSAFAGEEFVNCKATFTENNVSEVKKFKFKCDNYGAKATFESKSKRFLVKAFSEESCTPSVWLHDAKTNTVAVGVSSSVQGNGFDIYKGRTVAAGLAADITREEVMNAPLKDKATIECSAGKIEEQF